MLWREVDSARRQVLLDLVVLLGAYLVVLSVSVATNNTSRHACMNLMGVRRKGAVFLFEFSGIFFLVFFVEASVAESAGYQGIR